MGGRQPRSQQLSGLHIQSTPDDRTGVNIQSDTRTLINHWGLPTPVALPPGPIPVRQPTIVRGGAPAPLPSSSSGGGGRPPPDGPQPPPPGPGGGRRGGRGQGGG